MEGCLDCRKGREVHVGGRRAHRGEETEQEWQPRRERHEPFIAGGVPNCQCGGMSQDAANTTHHLTAAFGPKAAPVSRLGFGGATAGLSNYIEAYDAGHPANRDAMLAAL